MPIRNIEDLKLRLNDPKFEEKMKTDPVGTLDKETGPPIRDKGVFSMVICFLGIPIIIIIFGIIYLASIERAVPESIIAIGSAAVGALAGLLAPSPVRE